MRVFAVCSAAAFLGLAPVSNAQTWQPELSLGLQTGLEGGDIGGQVGWQRARTRIVAGLDLGIDDEAYTKYGGRIFAELERGLGVGVELGVLYSVLPELTLFGGAALVVAPQTLFGATGQATYRWELGETFAAGFLLNLTALSLGGDRSEDGNLFWMLLGANLLVKP